MSNVDYTKLNILTGPTYVPFKCAALNDCCTFSVHALGGLLNLTSKYGTMSNTDSYFNLAVGPRFEYNFTKKIGVGTQIDWNPVFPKSGCTISNNFSLALG